MDICEECLNPTNNISADRILVSMDSKKEGIIEIRPGVPELSLGDKRYSMVRVFIGVSKHFIKGMAVYSEEIPEGYDIVFYTRLKSNGTFAGYGQVERKRRTQKPFEIIEAPGCWKEWTESLPKLSSEFISRPKREKL